LRASAQGNKTGLAGAAANILIILRLGKGAYSPLQSGAHETAAFVRFASGRKQNANKQP
jgi:hypothetical protein